MRSLLAALTILSLAGPAGGATDPVIARVGAISVTAGQLRAMLASLPPAERATIASDPTSLATLLRGRMLQDMVYAAARAARYDRKPEIQAAAERARQSAIVSLYVAAQLPPLTPPTDAQIAAAYEANKARFMLPRQFHLAQIFLATEAAADDATIQAAKKRLVDLRPSLIGNPAAFAAAARRISGDKGSAGSGGDLGWLRVDGIAEPVRGVAMGLQEGAVSDPLRTADGWHLIELIATRPAGPAPLDQVRPSILQALGQQRRQTDTAAYLNGLLQHTPLQMDSDAIKRIAAP